MMVTNRPRFSGCNRELGVCFIESLMVWNYVYLGSELGGCSWGGYLSYMVTTILKFHCIHKKMHVM